MPYFSEIPGNQIGVVNYATFPESFVVFLVTQNICILIKDSVGKLKEVFGFIFFSRRLSFNDW